MPELSELLSQNVDTAFAAIEQPNTPEKLAAETVDTPATEPLTPVETVPVDTPATEPLTPVETAPVDTPATDIMPDYIKGIAADDWAKVPVQVREQFDTTIKQAREFVAEALPRLQVYEQLGQVLAPHMETISKAQVHPLQVVAGALQLGQTLWTGDANAKANTIADLIQEYGVDITALEKALVAKVQAAKDPVAQRIQQEMAPLQQTMQQVLGVLNTQQQQPAIAQQQAAQQEVQTEISTFATAKDAAGQLQNPHFEKVKTTMADIFSIAAKRGEQLTLKDAYTRACVFHGLPLTQAADKRVGLSVGGAAVTTPKPQVQRGRTISQALDAAFEQHQLQ